MELQQPVALEFNSDIQQNFIFNMPNERKKNLMNRWFATQSSSFTKDDIDAKLNKAQEKRIQNLESKKPSDTKHFEAMLRAIDNKTGTTDNTKLIEHQTKMQLAEERAKAMILEKKMKAQKTLKKVTYAVPNLDKLSKMYGCPQKRNRVALVDDEDLE